MRRNTGKHDCSTAEGRRAYNKEYGKKWREAHPTYLKDYRANRRKHRGKPRWAKDGMAMNLEEVGQALGITKERVRQIQNEALKKMAAELKARGIELRHLLPERTGPAVPDSMEVD